LQAIVSFNAIANHSQECQSSRGHYLSRLEEAWRRAGTGSQMIVCVCNAKNCRTVREVLSQGAHIDTPAAAHRAMGTTPQCGRCLPTIADMISEVRNENAVATALAAAD
jgi:bacterioferritin-associated ferredoxin